MNYLLHQRVKEIIRLYLKGKISAILKTKEQCQTKVHQRVRGKKK